mmetsp:Transcript_144333/g.448170  ORF Transcript_144333/g.448170 Transcript_144333/m.448170 type:complete len:247 (+) Transcript_144333:2173-2913(+)
MFHADLLQHEQPGRGVAVAGELRHAPHGVHHERPHRRLVDLRLQRGAVRAQEVAECGRPHARLLGDVHEAFEDGLGERRRQQRVLRRRQDVVAHLLRFVLDAPQEVGRIRHELRVARLQCLAGDAEGGTPHHEGRVSEPQTDGDLAIRHGLWGQQGGPAVEQVVDQVNEGDAHACGLILEPHRNRLGDGARRRELDVGLAGREQAAHGLPPHEGEGAALDLHQQASRAMRRARVSMLAPSWCSARL